MNNNGLPDTPLPGQSFSGSTSPRQLSRHGSASTPSHNNRYVYPPSNPMRRSPERDAMLVATSSRTDTPSRQIREALQNQFLGYRTSENQSPDPGTQRQPGTRRRSQPLTNLLDSHPHLNVPPTPLSPHATPFVGTSQHQSAFNPPNQVPQNTTDISGQTHRNEPDVQILGHQAPNPYPGSNISQNLAQQATQHVLNLQRAGETSQNPPQATNTHQSPFEQAYQSSRDAQTSSAHNVNRFAVPQQQQQQTQPRQQVSGYFPPAPAYVPPGYDGPQPSGAPDFSHFDPRYVPATPASWRNYSQNTSSYEANTQNQYQPAPPCYNPQAPQYPLEHQFQAQNFPSGASTPHAETLNNLRSNARTSSTHLPLPPHDPTARKAEARAILKDLEHDKRKLIHNRKATFQEIQDLEGSLANLKGRRDAMIARRDWLGEVDRGRNRIDSLGGSIGDGGEGMRTPTMPAAMRAAMGSQQTTSGQGAYSVNADQQFSAASTPQAGLPRSMSIGQQIFSLEKDLADVTYIHGEYGRMFKNVEDNMEQMWEAVYCPEGGWPEDDY